MTKVVLILALLGLGGCAAVPCECRCVVEPLPVFIPNENMEEIEVMSRPPNQPDLPKKLHGVCNTDKGFLDCRSK